MMVYLMGLHILGDTLLLLLFILLLRLLLRLLLLLLLMLLLLMLLMGLGHSQGVDSRSTGVTWWVRARWLDGIGGSRGHQGPPRPAALPGNVAKPRPDPSCVC